MTASENLECPRCPGIKLSDEPGPKAGTCGTCQGQFVYGKDVRPDYLDVAEPVDNATDLLQCPACPQPMARMKIETADLDRCESCGGIWFDADEYATEKNATSPGRLLLYSLTLPERLVRSTVGVAAGTVFETASVLVPRSFQNAKTYQIVVRNSCNFLTQNVGGVAADEEEAGDDAIGDDFVARKAVGNFVDIAGWATLHVSPVWIMAIVSDVAYGTKTYVQELAEELEKQGLIDDSSTIHNVDDVLGAVQNATSSAASMFDTPPLNVDDLKESLENTKDAIKSADYTSVLPEAEIARFWGEMKDVAKKEDVSLVGVSGAMAMNTLGKLNTVSRGTLTGIKVVGGLFNEHVLQHYTTSLRTIHEQGFFQTVRDSSGPYVEAVWNNFSADRSTFTEEVITGRAPARLFSKVKGWFSGDEKSDGTESP